MIFNFILNQRHFVLCHCKNFVLMQISAYLSLLGRGDGGGLLLAMLIVSTKAFYCLNKSLYYLLYFIFISHLCFIIIITFYYFSQYIFFLNVKRSLRELTSRFSPAERRVETERWRKLINEEEEEKRKITNEGAH